MQTTSNILIHTNVVVVQRAVLHVENQIQAYNWNFIVANSLDSDTRRSSQSVSDTGVSFGSPRSVCIELWSAVSSELVS